VPLWDPTTGQFPCGATVAGLNDGEASCKTVHTRLHVGTADCPVPVVGTAAAVLTWQAPAAGGEPQAYEIWRQAPSQSKLATVPPTQFTYTDQAASAQTCYTVASVNAAGQSAAEPVCLAAPATPPGPPQGLSVAPQGGAR
jgi:hypothetical protein